MTIVGVTPSAIGELQQHLDELKTDDTLLFMPGIYRRVSLTVKQPNITLLGTGGAVFDGEGEEVYAIRLGHDLRGGAAHITIGGFTFRRYNGYGVHVWGHKEDEAGWIARVDIIRNAFVECSGFGAVDLVNARSCRVTHNVFLNNQGRKGEEGLMHDIYLAHRSLTNALEENLHVGCSGSPVKFRDRSSENLVRGAIFRDTGNGRLMEERPSKGEGRSVRNVFVDISWNRRDWKGKKTKLKQCTKEKKNRCRHDQFIRG